MSKKLVTKEYDNDGLTDMQREFCIQYVACNNASESARRAGYSEKNITVQASKLMNNPKIKEKINQLRIDRKLNAINDNEVDKETVIKWIADIANPINEFKYNTTHRMKALELLGKAIGLFVEKKEITQDVNVNHLSNLSDEELDKLYNQYANGDVIEAEYKMIEN